MTPLYTVGHSNHPADRFRELLTRCGVGLLVDVRRKPFSRFNPQFNRERLAAELSAFGIDYLWEGEALGGKRPGMRFAAIAARPEFRAGLDRVRDAAASRPTAIVCAERDPLDCHRAILVARQVRDRLAIRHILADGSIEDDAAFAARLLAKTGETPPPLLAADPGARAAAIERAYDALGRKMSGGVTRRSG